MCGHKPQNGGLPLVTGYFGRSGLGYEGDSELLLNSEEGSIQYSEDVFSSLPEPEEDCVHMFESKITHKSSPPSKKSQPLEPLELIIKMIKPPLPLRPAPVVTCLCCCTQAMILPLQNTSARTVPLTGGGAIRFPCQIPRPSVKSPQPISSCIIC